MRKLSRVIAAAVFLSALPGADCWGAWARACAPLQTPVLPVGPALSGMSGGAGAPLLHSPANALSPATPSALPSLLPAIPSALAPVPVVAQRSLKALPSARGLQAAVVGVARARVSGRFGEVPLLLGALYGERGRGIGFGTFHTPQVNAAVKTRTSKAGAGAADPHPKLSSFAPGEDGRQLADLMRAAKAMDASPEPAEVMIHLLRIQNAADQHAVDQIQKFADVMAQNPNPSKSVYYKSGGGLARSSGGTWYYPNGTMARSSGGTWYYPNSAMARTSGDTWYYPNSTMARTSGGTWYYPNSAMARTSGDTWYYPNSTMARTSGGTWYDPNGNMVPRHSSYGSQGTTTISGKTVTTTVKAGGVNINQLKRKIQQLAGEPEEKEKEDEPPPSPVEDLIGEAAKKRAKDSPKVVTEALEIIEELESGSFMDRLHATALSKRVDKLELALEDGTEDEIQFAAQRLEEQVKAYKSGRGVQFIPALLGR